MRKTEKAQRMFTIRKGSSGWFVDGLGHGTHMKDVRFKHIHNYRMGCKDGRVEYPLNGSIWNTLKGGTICHGHQKTKISIDTTKELATQNNGFYFGINYDNSPWQE